MATEKVENFITFMREAGHREATLVFIRDVAGEELSGDSFARRWKNAVKTNAAPCKGRNLFRFLVQHGIVRDNAR